jgi:hypothetical protein
MVPHLISDPFYVFIGKDAPITVITLYFGYAMFSEPPKESLPRYTKPPSRFCGSEGVRVN